MDLFCYYACNFLTHHDQTVQFLERDIKLVSFGFFAAIYWKPIYSLAGHRIGRYYVFNLFLNFWNILLTKLGDKTKTRKVKVFKIMEYYYIFKDNINNCLDIIKMCWQCLNAIQHIFCLWFWRWKLNSKISRNVVICPWLGNNVLPSNA